MFNKEDVRWARVIPKHGNLDPRNEDSQVNCGSIQNSESYRDSMIHEEAKKLSFVDEPGARQQTFPSVIVRESAMT